MTERELLRRAIDSEPVPRDLNARVRTHLDQQQLRLLPLLGSAIACVGLLFVITHVYAVSMLTTGLDDHVNCALEHHFPAQDSEGEMALAVGPQFAPLLQPISQRAGGLKLIAAHQCTVKDRQYVHFVFSGSDGLTSVSLTKKRPLEWIPGQQQRRIHGIHVVGFEDEDYLVFISSLQSHEELTNNLPQILSYRM